MAFGHIETIGEKVLIIGVGNTAMDCCRTSLRLGAKNVKVMARKPREFFKASPWELEDAEEENVEIVVNHSPKRFVVENGKLIGMMFEEMEYEVDAHGRITAEKVVGEERFPCDDVILAIGQENAFPWIERDIGIEFDKWEVPGRGRGDLPVHAGRASSSAATPRSGRRTSSGRSSTATRRPFPSTSIARAKSITERLPLRHESREHPRWACTSGAFSNDYDPAERRLMPHVEPQGALQEAQHRGRARLHRRSSSRRKSSAASTATSRRSSPTKLCIECDACIDICPAHCLTITPQRRRGGAAHAAVGTVARTSTRLCTFPAPLPQTGRVMVKDEDLCVHCSLCAERCPTGAWDMQKFTLRFRTPPTRPQAVPQAGPAPDPQTHAAAAVQAERTAA